MNPISALVFKNVLSPTTDFLLLGAEASLSIPIPLGQIAT